MTKHYSEEDLILYYYGESGRRADVEQHLTECAACESLYRGVSGMLATITAPDVPERDDQYGLEVWQRIRQQLPERRRSWGIGAGGWAEKLGWARGLAMAGAAAVLLIGAFVAGRLVPPSAVPSQQAAAPVAIAPAAGTDEPNRDRILLTSVADHLERSERMLTDIMNAPDRGDISLQQASAEDLLQTSRLYRQDAVAAGEQSVADVLDELERNLIEIVHSPSQISAADLEQIRRRIDAAALLFKVRVMSDELRQRDGLAKPAASPAPTGKTS